MADDSKLRTLVDDLNRIEVELPPAQGFEPVGDALDFEADPRELKPKEDTFEIFYDGTQDFEVFEELDYDPLLSLLTEPN